MITFAGKKILVTGASSGIGREVSIQLAELGAKVTLIARDETRLIETISLMKGKGHKYFSYDISNIDGIKELITKTVTCDNTKIDGYIHCAGIVDIYPLKVIDYKKFENIMKINTYSYLEIIKYLSKKQFSNEQASIVFVSAIMTKVPKKGQATYIASKAAGDSISKVLSLELIRRKIRINSVLVGSVMTKMVEDTHKYRQLSTENEKNNYSPVHKTLSSREVSNMIMFLVSDSSKYIIGESYNIDGGYF